MKDFVKALIVYVTRVFTHLFWIFPIKRNRVLFVSQNGGQYSCNPKYISEYLVNQKKYEIIWAFNDPEKFAELKEQGVKLVKYRSLQYYFYKATAKVSICNVNGSGEVGVRKSQFDIQTWHGGGGGYKKSSTDDKTISKLDKKRLELDNARYSLCCASSRTNMNNTILGAMHHTGLILGGTPRNDILVNANRPEITKKVHEYFGLDDNIKLFLFAPTWRKGRKATDYSLDYEQLKQALAKRFGGEWVILLRFHHMVKYNPSDIKGDVINATPYPDMQELLYATDVLMTDYSSSIWDYSFTYKPCFLYCVDLKDFRGERDFYSPIHTWGFPVCETDEELLDSIASFDEEDFKKKMDSHHQRNESFEDGKATEHIAEIIEAVCFGNGKLPKGLPYKQ